jgi:hypothetical protein
MKAALKQKYCVASATVLKIDNHNLWTGLAAQRVHDE